MTAQETSSPDAAASSVSCKYPDRQSLPGSADRNAPAISSALERLLSQLPKNSKILELAAGHGVLTAQMAAAWPSLRFSASEADDGLVEAIRQRCQGLVNVEMIQRLEFSNAREWEQLQEQGPFDLIIVANVLHIVPWLTVEDLFSEFAPDRVLNGAGGRVCIYGAFNEGGTFTSEGNEKASGRGTRELPNFS